MGYEALLFCPDEKTARTVTQVLSELEFNVEACLEPFAAVKKLMGQHFDAVVVDCDNEQNATLLFKSARNSTSNQASLAVAVVEGQAGVAKAFRIGANLVLTKPINIEQSKGTLRVARGLLRKGEPSKPAATPTPGTTSLPAVAVPAKPVAAKPVPPARPVVPAKPAAVAAPRPAAPPVAKPVVKPTRPAVAAPTTSIPAAHAPAAQHPVNSAVAASGPGAPPAEDLPRISAENTAAAPAAAALTASAKIAALPTRAMKLPASMPSAPTVKPASSGGLPAALGGGAASAPAPAREVEESHVAEMSLENAATSEATLLKPETDSPADKPAEAGTSEPAYVGAAPAFTFGGANLPEEKTGKSKKTFLGVAAAVLVGAALFYGWTQYKGTVSQPVRIAAPAPTPTKPLAAAPKPATSSSSPATSTTPGSAPTDSTSQSGSHPIASPATNPNDEDDSPDATAPASTKPAGSTASATAKTSGSDKTGLDKTGPDKTGSDKTGSDKTAPEKTGSAKSSASPLVVKGGTAPTLRAAGATPDAPAPSMTGIAAAGAAAPPPNLGSTASAPKPILQTVSISQGVSRGLLIHQVSPVYPKAALAMRIEGTVELTTTISKSGDIAHVKIVSGDPQLAKAAADAVKQWKYKPYLLNGEPVDIQTVVTVNFKLPN
jgi:TonB family protein